MIATSVTKRAGLLATNSIRGGANRKVLERVNGSGDIFWAWSDREWLLDGAAVNVSMVAFDDGTERSRLLDNKVVAAVNADLTMTKDLTKALPLPENAGISFIGPSPKAPFDVERSVGEMMLGRPVNVNGRPNSDVVKPVVSGIDIVQGSRHLYTVDFGMMSLKEASEFRNTLWLCRIRRSKARETRHDDYRGQWWQSRDRGPRCVLLCAGSRGSLRPRG